MTERKFTGPPIDHVQQSLNTLQTEVEKIQDSDTFRAYLDVQARFHKYSPLNVMLIRAQRPDATDVAGFNTWRNLDRWVRKGEKAVWILAPLRKKQIDPETGDETYRVYGYRSVSVFDIGQTEGAPLPKILVPELYSDEGRELYDKLAILTQEDGFRLIAGSPRTDNVMGYTDPASKLVMVRQDLSQLQRTKTLAHELSHIVGGHFQSDSATETEAEASAYVVLRHHGLDSGERSFPYISTWSQDKRVLRQAMGNIQRISSRIIQRLNPQDRELPVS